MKELSMQEVEQVSGGFIGVLFAPIGAVMGGVIGGIVDAGTAAAGFKSNFAAAGALLGGGIAAAVGLAPVTATAGIGLGVVGIVNNGLSLSQQKKATA